MIEIPITEEMVPNLYISVVALSGTSPEQPVPEFRMGYVKLAVSTEKKQLNIQLSQANRNKSEPAQPGETVTFNVRISDPAGQPVQAELSLAIVDKAVLALAEDRQTSLMDAFYSQQPLAVRTGGSLSINIDRLNERFIAGQDVEGLGGGGGGGGAAGADLRNEILDTAYWKADLVTDDDGQAEVSIT